MAICFLLIMSVNIFHELSVNFGHLEFKSFIVT